jgi:hypothetical protein
MGEGYGNGVVFSQSHSYFFAVFFCRCCTVYLIVGMAWVLEVVLSKSRIIKFQLLAGSASAQTTQPFSRDKAFPELLT